MVEMVVGVDDVDRKWNHEASIWTIRNKSEKGSQLLKGPKKGTKEGS